MLAVASTYSARDILASGQDVTLLSGGCSGRVGPVRAVSREDDNATGQNSESGGAELDHVWLVF